MGDGGGPLGPERLGRYRLLRKLAVGGMAEIYLARVSGPGGFEKNVVVKRILPQLAESDEFFAMFLDEARIAAMLQHANLVHIYDAGQVDDEFFIAMEHLDGADLHTVHRVLSERGAAADGGQAIPLQHAIFIVNSDVTPQNVFLTREGGVKLVDFGVAKSANRVSSTTFGTLKGKLPYMSPEQCRAELVDRRSDIYSLGVLLYELTCGRRPHEGRSEYELLREIVEGVVRPPSLSVPDYPAELEAIAMCALAAHPADRYPSALAMGQDLERFVRRHELVGSTMAMAEFLAPVLDAAQQQAQARQRRRSTGPHGGDDELDGSSDADREETVVSGRRPARLSTQDPLYREPADDTQVNASPMTAAPISAAPMTVAPMTVDAQGAEPVAEPTAK
jgi:serine/threonine protein kinase